jgi:hypothetical protein
MYQIFNSRAISAFRPLQHKETLTAMEGLLNSPDSFVDHFRRYVGLLHHDVPILTSIHALNSFAASTILKITYGHEVHSADDRFVLLGKGTIVKLDNRPLLIL